MEISNYNLRSANKAFVLACLLAVTAFMAGPLQVGAEPQSATQVNLSSASFGAMVTVPGHTVPQVLDGRATRLSHYNPEQKLRLALALTPPHMAEEEEFITELTTKGSPNFHQFLSAEEWNARFAPAAEDEQKVVDWANSQGLTVTKRYANRLLVDVEAPAGVIEKAFGVTLNNYQVGEEVDFANDRDPVLPSTVAEIVHSVLGLNSIDRFHRLEPGASKQKGPDYVAGPALAEGGHEFGDGDLTKAPANRAASMASSPIAMTGPALDGGVADPDNITSSEAYDYDALHALSHCCNVHGYSTGSPAQSSIALVTYGNFQVSDVTTFFKRYGLAWNLNWYYVNGTGYPGQDDEAPLDVEYSTAMSNSYGASQDTAHVFIYEAPNNLYATYADIFNDIGSDGHAKVVSTSYGWEEGVGFSDSEANSVMHGIFNTLVGEGLTLIAAAGDNGASDGCQDAIAVDYPASDPDFIAAGGTELLLNSSGNFVSETAWVGETWSGACSSNHGGGGGGVSANFAQPYWQTPLGFTKRAMPDISLTANPDVMGEWYYYNGGWHNEGGTSIVAPELAGFFAQENSYLDYIGDRCGSTGTSACTPVGNAAVYMYYDGIDGAPHDPFYDITSGCNSNDVTAFYGLGSYCAHTGFDLATGWGSANMLQLAWGINWELIPAYGHPSISFSGPATGQWYNTNETVAWSVSDAGSGSFPAPGVAGFTQGWDSIPADPGSEPHGGSGNSFYSGPEYPFATAGCLAFEPNGCAGGVSQGCHTAWVEGWDNEGRTAVSSYGPVCFDTVAPITKASLSGILASGSYYSSVNVALTASDNASGVQSTYYQLDGGTTIAYTGLFTVTANGSHSVKFWSVDVAGNVGTAQTVSFKIAAGRPAVLTTPTPGATLAGSSVKFGWTAGTAATDYELLLGSKGVGSDNLHTSSKSKATSVSVTKLPTNGETIYARLITYFGSIKVHTDYTYKAE